MNPDELRLYRREQSRRRRLDPEYRERERVAGRSAKRRLRGSSFGGMAVRWLCCDCVTIFIVQHGTGRRCPICRDWRKSEESKRERRSSAATKLTEEERALSLERHRAYLREYRKTEEYKIKKRAETRKRIQAKRSRRIVTDLEKIKRAIDGTTKI